MNSLHLTLRRKDPLVVARPARHKGGPRRIADNLSRRLADGATVELLTEALHRLVALVYEQDAAGWVNADPVTGRILIPVPWGRLGKRKWGLYPSEADTLRSILRERRKGPAAPLFMYDAGARSWLVALAEYPTAGAALAYLRQRPITVDEYRIHRRKVTR
jgi:hypothetical protein